MPKRSCSRSLQTRSLAQKSACKDLSRNGQDRAITPEATYTPTSNRASSRSHLFTPCFFLWDSLNLYIECMADGSWACLPEIAFYI
ncbi:ATP-dependent nuclease subunit B [Lacticaseibacillus zeae]|uniref:ATP-dependent nuclease subunit B n=1 Tax=Lacticaseibacillus zeae TaxID=57037 RepID=A0A5R8LP59_LACZE|nr:ATP-dependent nuclease subunit B [Lacticaseibacillus zeae]